MGKFLIFCCNPFTYSFFYSSYKHLLSTSFLSGAKEKDGCDFSAPKKLRDGSGTHYSESQGKVRRAVIEGSPEEKQRVLTPAWAVREDLLEEVVPDLSLLE